MFDSCETPSVPASQVPGTRFVRYQNRYLGWVTWQELPKHAPHALAHLIAAKPPNLPLFEVSLVFWTGVFLSSGRNYYNREGNRPKGRVFMGKLTLLQRQQAVELFEQGYGYVLVSRMLELKQSQVELLSRMWRIHGRLCLMRRKNQQYSFETKKEVVTRYLQGDNPIELAKQYNISSDRLIRIWVKKWKTSGDVALRPRLTGYPPVQDTGTPLTEVEKLKRDNYYLQMQVDVLKKLKALRETPPSGN